MKVLRLLGYRGLSMGALTPYLTGERSGRVVGITFDDGYLNNLQNALPILQRQGFSSTCYVVSGEIGSTNRWDADLGIAQVPLMDHSALQAWIEGGQEVGSHTRSHANLTQVNPQQLEAEICGSRQELESLLTQEGVCSTSVTPMGVWTVRPSRWWPGPVIEPLQRQHAAGSIRVVNQIHWRCLASELTGPQRFCTLR